MWKQVKLLGHMGKVSLKGVVNDELLDIDTDGELLSLCDKVPLSYQRVVLIYVQHIEEEDVAMNEDCEEVGVALNRRIVKRKLKTWDSSDDDGPLNSEGNRADIGGTDVEDKNEGSEKEDKEDGPDFVDSAYEHSENELNGSEWIQVKKLVYVHDCGTVDHKFHANSTSLAQRYATQLSRLHNWDMGTFKHQYELLWNYAAKLRKTNVGSTVIIKCELEGVRPRFQRIYICLAAVKQGFLQGFMPVIGFDACHIKSHHLGQLLSNVGMDPNNGMFPIVYVVAKD
ncbi:uncharacterized protein Pyn_13787 [Prunus yedoensis var. nudiflora]|uniref:Uncharacterized protein n=1 Tax=Prunus yedoensis var. nudiflora TaxID=2094558 RepID=A0A314Y5W3_PRUYE|nr:uncharacterized protein Pyn_13787 [Prunus yedoensis var. nudiflora]